MVRVSGELQVKSNRFQETNVASIDCKLSAALNYNNLQQDRQDIGNYLQYSPGKYVLVSALCQTLDYSKGARVGF